MKFIDLFLAALFGLSAYWQLNDPDWAVWTLAYGSVTLVALWHYLGDPVRPIVYVLLGIITIWWLTYIPDFIQWLADGTPNIATEMKTEEPHIELTREFFGLLLMGLALGYYAVWRRAKLPPNPK